MTLDEFLEQDPNAKIEITSHSDQGCLAYLTGSMWYNDGTTRTVVIRAFDSTINGALELLTTRLPRDIKKGKANA